MVIPHFALDFRLWRELVGIRRFERMLRIYEPFGAAEALCLRDYVQSERGLSRRLGFLYFYYAPAWKPAGA